MDNATFKSKVTALVARSRKALRLYSNAGRGFNDRSRHKADASLQIHKDSQTKQWRDVTSDLLNELTSALQSHISVKDLSAAIYVARDKFNLIWRTLESDIHLKQKELLASSESGDFVRAACLSGQLVAAKARLQASQAAHHELDELIKKTRYAHQPIELSNNDVLEDARSNLVNEIDADQKSVANLPGGIAKVIPLRKIL